MPPRAPKIKLDSVTRTAPMTPRKMDQISEANGALPSNSTSVGSVTKTQETTPRKETTVLSHQTHGAVLPRGPIMSVGQLIGGGTAIAGSMGSFETLQDYRNHIDKLSLGALHRHALEEAKIVPIDDRNRLIRRLETEWTATVRRSPGFNQPPIPQPKPFTKEQTEAQEAIRNKILRR